MSADHCCKVGGLIDKYDLTPPALVAGDIDNFLEVRWKGLGQHEPVGFRQLAEWFNKLVLRTAYERHDRQVIDTNLNAEYETLTGSDDTSGERVELLGDLEADGIDGEALTNDFVSKSTIARHLKNCLDAGGKETQSTTSGNWYKERIQMSRDQFQTYLQKPLNHLDKTGRLPGASQATLTTPIVLTCPHCPTRAHLSDALDRGYICDDHFGRAEQESPESNGETQSLDPDDEVLGPNSSLSVDEAWQAFVS
jgi:hypothetical protein